MAKLVGRLGWRGTLVVIALAVAVIYALAHGSATGGTVAAKHGGYSYDKPKGWDHRTPCGEGRVNSPGVLDDSCTKPSMREEAGVYLLSQAIAAGHTAAELAGQLAGTIKGYQPCPGRGGEGACLRSTANADHRGVLRVRVLKTLAVVVVCLRTDQRSVDQGCDLVFNHITVGISRSAPGSPAARR